MHITVIATGFESNPFGSTAKAEPEKIEKAAETTRVETAAAPRRERMVELEEEGETPVSPIFERRANRAPRPSREEMERRAQQPAPRRPRVYQDGASDDNRTRRGFTPDTPSFLKRNNNK